MTISEYSALGGHKHGMSRTPEHQAWLGMRQRCRDANHPSYSSYGGRGIAVAPQWDNDADGFQLFFEHVGLRPDGCSLDRINPHGNYEPGNVRWAAKDLQEANKRPVLETTAVPGVFYCRKNGKLYREVPDWMLDAIDAEFAAVGVATPTAHAIVDANHKVGV